MDIRCVVGRNIKYYRKMAGLTQEEFAEDLQSTAKHISSIEVGSSFISYKMLERVVSQLNISADQLFRDPESKEYVFSQYSDAFLLNTIDEKLAVKELISDAAAQDLFCMAEFLENEVKNIFTYMFKMFFLKQNDDREIF